MLIIARKENQHYLANKVIEAFKILNEDSSEGLISLKFLKDILLSLGDNMTMEELNYFMEEIELDKEGSFDYIKFVDNVIQ